MCVNAGLSLHKCRELCSGNTNCTGRAGLVQAVKSFFFSFRSSTLSGKMNH